MLHPGFLQLLNLLWADTAASCRDFTDYDWAQSQYLVMRDECETEPIVTGDTLIEMGFKPGPMFREILEACFEVQLGGESDLEKLKAYVLLMFDPKPAL
jgi:hypothetical protein